MTCFLMLAAALLFIPAADQDPSLAADYGFGAMEIYQVDHGVYNLAFGDLNGDGRTDMAFINNARSRVELYLRLPDDAPDAYEIADPEAHNELTYDGRFQKEFISVEQQILSLALGRFDEDDTQDVALVTDTGELILVLRAGSRKTIRLESFKPVADGLIGEDVDGDGTDDLIALGEKRILLWLQQGEGWHQKPRVLFHGEDKPGDLRLTDLNGDGFKDLLYVYYRGSYPFHIRYQEAPGHFGPVTSGKLEGIRAYDVKNMDARPGEEVLAVYGNSGRLALFGLTPSEEPLLRQYPLREARDEDSITYTAADVDDDGMAELIAAEAGAARILLLDGLGDGASATAAEFPSLRGVKDPRVADLDGDGTKELIVVSGTEQVIGLSKAGRRIDFPRFVPVEGEPLAMDTGDVDGDGTEDVVCLTLQGEGRKKTYLLNVLYSAEEGASVGRQVIQEYGANDKAITKDPLDLLMVDLDGNGLADALLFVPGEVPVVYLNRGEGRFTFAMGDDTPGLGILKEARRWSVCPVDSDGDGRLELVSCSGNLARYLYFPEGSEIPQAMDQYNSPDPADEYTGCAVGDVTGDGKPELILYEKNNHRLHLVGRGGEEVAKIDVGRMEFRGVEVVELNGDGKPDLLVKGRNRIGVCLSGSPCMVLTERGTYEGKDKKSYFLDVAAGDVNRSGAPDVALVDSGQKSLFLVALLDGELKHALKFKVFEEKLFHGGKGGAEPHGIKISDVSGDGREDVVLLVHDKIILYLQ